MPSFTDAVFRGAMLVLLDGSDPATAPRVLCKMRGCGKPLLRVFTTAGARRADPTLPPHRDACINKRWLGAVPCPEAMKSAGLVDQLMGAATR